MKRIKESEDRSLVAMILELIVLFLFSPLVVFIGSYAGGMILDLAFGAKLVDGLNLMFNTTRFTRDLVPLACATLGTIGSYFNKN